MDPRESEPSKRHPEPRWLGSSSPTRIALVPPLSLARWLLVLVLAAGIYFFRDFVVPVLDAVVIGFASWPLYSALVRQVGGNRTAAAPIAIVLILGFLIVPIVLAIGYAIEEIGIWFTWVVVTNKMGAP